MLSAYDPYVNMLRSTVAAFADRFVARGRCPADELTGPTGLTGLAGPTGLTGTAGPQHGKGTR